MIFRNLLFAVYGFILGILFIGVVGKIHVDNLHHVTCKMYNSVENNSRYSYVDDQFRCNK
jgi:hypothetical protein